MSSAKEITSKLRSKYKVDEFFYPDISMSTQIPDGLEGEVADILELLTENEFEASAENVLRVVQLKKELLTEYCSEPEKKTLSKYQELLATKVKPVGSAIPIDLIFVDGLVLIALSMLAKFGYSFAAESGKLLARKVFRNNKMDSKKLKMTEAEYQFLKPEVVVVMGSHSNALMSLKKDVFKKPRKHRSNTSRNKTKKP
jgi:hypothetical protein